jgi:hypothetical protein
MLRVAAKKLGLHNVALVSLPNCSDSLWHGLSLKGHCAKSRSFWVWHNLQRMFGDGPRQLAIATELGV